MTGAHSALAVNPTIDFWQSSILRRPLTERPKVQATLTGMDGACSQQLNEQKQRVQVRGQRTERKSKDRKRQATHSHPHPHPHPHTSVYVSEKDK